MDDKKNVIKKFYEMLSRDIDNEVEDEIVIKEIAEFQNVLIIRSMQNPVLYQLLDELNLTGERCRVTLLGSGFDMKYLRELSQKCETFQYDIVTYDGIFDINRISEYKKQIGEKNIKAVVFLCPAPNRESYVNIELVAESFAAERKLPVYLYTDKKEIYRYKDITNHVNGIRLLAAFVQWFRE